MNLAGAGAILQSGLQQAVSMPVIVVDGMHHTASGLIEVGKDIVFDRMILVSELGFMCFYLWEGISLTLCLLL